MNSRTGIPEIIVGLVAAYMFALMFPAANTLQYVTLTDVTATTELKLVSAVCVMIVGLYGLIAGACLLPIFERWGLGSLDRIADYYREYHEGWL